MRNVCTRLRIIDFRFLEAGISEHVSLIVVPKQIQLRSIFVPLELRGRWTCFMVLEEKIHFKVILSSAFRELSWDIIGPWSVHCECLLNLEVGWQIWFRLWVCNAKLAMIFQIWKGSLPSWSTFYTVVSRFKHWWCVLVPSSKHLIMLLMKSVIRLKVSFPECSLSFSCIIWWFAVHAPRVMKIFWGLAELKAHILRLLADPLYLSIKVWRQYFGIHHRDMLLLGLFKMQRLSTWKLRRDLSCHVGWGLR